MLFGYVEVAESFEKSLSGMSKEDVNAKWQKFMAPLFENLHGNADQSMLRLESVFHLD